jgi:hypothetical protein
MTTRATTTTQTRNSGLSDVGIPRSALRLTPETGSPVRPRLAAAHSRHHIAPLLNREWALMTHRASLVRRARSWGIAYAEFTTLDQLLVLAGHCTEGTPASERLLRDLVLLADTDDLAARIVIQRLLPGLMALVRKYNGRNGEDQVLEELVGAAWITIRTFNPDRRPSCLAAALIGGAEHRAFKAAARRRSASEIISAPEEFAVLSTEPSLSSEEEMEELLVLARASGLSEEDLNFVDELLSCGSTTIMAEQRGVTARTIRNHRNAVTYRIRRSVSVHC